MAKRIVTAIILLAVVLAAVFCPSPYPLMALAAIAALLANAEAAVLMKRSKYLALAAPALLSAAGFVLLALHPNPQLVMGLGVAGILLLGWALVPLQIAAGRTAKDLPIPFTTLFISSLWTSVPLLVLALLPAADQVLAGKSSIPLVLAILLPVWASDIAGFFVGRSFGKKPLAPKISPGKTVEGAIGSLVAAGIIEAALFAAMNLLSIPAVSIIFGAVTGLLLGVCTIAGDLFESKFKRILNVKDSGSLLPGHGGILDRIDGLLFAACIGSGWLATILSLYAKSAR